MSHHLPGRAKHCQHDAATQAFIQWLKSKQPHTHLKTKTNQQKNQTTCCTPQTKTNQPTTTNHAHPNLNLWKVWKDKRKIKLHFQLSKTFLFPLQKLAFAFTNAEFPYREPIFHKCESMPLVISHLVSLFLSIVKPTNATDTSKQGYET